MTLDSGIAKRLEGCAGRASYQLPPDVADNVAMVQVLKETFYSGMEDGRKVMEAKIDGTTLSIVTYFGL